jgi:hypothetical protein
MASGRAGNSADISTAASNLLQPTDSSKDDSFSDFVLHHNEFD